MSAFALSGIREGHGAKGHGANGHGAPEVLRGATLEAADGELIALVAPSGRGDSTLSRIAAGLDAPDAGAVGLGGQLVPEGPGRRARIEARVFERATTRFHPAVEDDDGAPAPRAGRPSREVAGLAPGDAVRVGVDPRDVHVAPAASRPAA